VPATSSDAEHAPDYRVHLGDADAGWRSARGWKRTGEKAGTYLSLVLDDPSCWRSRSGPICSSPIVRGVPSIWSDRPVKRDDRR
jgi:uncharacterized protein (DUF736 family)